MVTGTDLGVVALMRMFCAYAGCVMLLAMISFSCCSSAHFRASLVRLRTHSPSAMSCCLRATWLRPGQREGATGIQADRLVLAHRSPPILAKAFMTLEKPTVFERSDRLFRRGRA